MTTRRAHWLLERLVRKYPSRDFGLNDPLNDFVVVEMTSDDPARLVARSVTGGVVHCRRHVPQAQPVEEEIPIDEFLSRPIVVMVYKGGVISRCDTLWEGFRYSYLGAARLWLARQRRYDRNLVGYRQRMEILEASVRLRESQASQATLDDTIRFSALAVELYGEPITTSEHQLEHFDVLDLRLRSFVDSGEIQIAEATHRIRTFRVSPKAYETLARYSTDERRHSDSVRVQWWLFIASAILAVIAALQLYEQLSRSR